MCQPAGDLGARHKCQFSGAADFDLLSSTTRSTLVKVIVLLAMMIVVGQGELAFGFSVVQLQSAKSMHCLVTPFAADCPCHLNETAYEHAIAG